MSDDTKPTSAKEQIRRRMEEQAREAVERLDREESSEVPRWWRVEMARFNAETERTVNLFGPMPKASA